MSADSATPRFDVHPHRPDGGFSTTGSGLLLVISMVAGSVLGAIAAGDVAKLVPRVPGSTEHPQRTVDLVACVQCHANAPIEVRFVRHTLNENKSPVQNIELEMTYPGEALPVLKALFAPPQAQVNTTAPASRASGPCGGAGARWFASANSARARDRAAVPTVRHRRSRQLP